MKRRGFNREQITSLRRAYRLLFANEGTFNERFEEVGNLYGHEEEVAGILEFIRRGDKPLAILIGKRMTTPAPMGIIAAAGEIPSISLRLWWQRANRFHRCPERYRHC